VIEEAPGGRERLGRRKGKDRKKAAIKKKEAPASSPSRNLLINSTRTSDQVKAQPGSSPLARDKRRENGI
jgi:hypothetical protein